MPSPFKRSFLPLKLIGGIEIVVVPFGVGAIIEFEDEALMQAGLEAWPENEPPPRRTNIDCPLP